jgi:hypothetical protein
MRQVDRLADGHHVGVRTTALIIRLIRGVRERRRRLR